jgi:hypothetical protein
MSRVFTLIFVVLFMIASVLFTDAVSATETPLILQLKGRAIGETRPIPPIEATNTREGNCFNVELIDVRHQENRGTAIRCFTDVQTSQDGLALTETTFLQLPEGQIVARQRITFQPIIDGASDMTHITGSVPMPLTANLLPDANTTRFRGMAGHMRVSGVINLRYFRDKNEIAFDDIAIVHFTDGTDQVKQAQRRLREEDFYQGAIDGIIGVNTTTALRQYQAKYGLPKTGELDQATRKAMGMR